MNTTMNTTEFEKLRDELSPPYRQGLDFVIELLTAVEQGSKEQCQPIQNS